MKMDDTLCDFVGNPADATIEKIDGEKCQCLLYNKERNYFKQCQKSSAVIVARGTVLQTVFCANCYKTLEKHPAYKPLEEITSLARE